MPTRTTVAIAALATVSAAAAAIGIAALPAAAAPTGRTLHLTTEVVASTPVDLGKKGDSVGDRFEDLFTVLSHGKKIGTFTQDCVLMRDSETDPLALCSGAFVLGGSTIEVSTVPGGSAVLHGAVIGGTGRFAGASGTIDVKTGQTATVTVHLTR